MAEKVPQTFANHARYDPFFHFFMLPVFLISWIISLVMLVRHPGFLAAWGVVLMTAVVTAGFKIRLYSLRVQDRVIRLEERLRLATLLPEAGRGEIANLSEDHLVALRFASDAEVALLAARCAREKLSRKQLKQAIQTWRPDYWRV